MKSPTSLLAGLALCGLLGPASAATGTWASFVGVDADADGPDATQWYDTSAWATDLLPDFANANLGSFTQGSSAWLTGADLFVWKNSGGDVTGARAYWRVDSGAWQELTLNWGSNVPLTIPGTASTTGGGEDQSWRLVGGQVNFLAGASAGQHRLQVYFKALTNEGDRLNGSADTPFSAGFSVSAVPEPASTALWLAGLVAVGLGAARRRMR